MKRTTILLVILLAGLGLSGGTALADSRTERPFQLQLDLSGLTVGYHVSELIYVGYTHQAELTARNRECSYCGDRDEFEIYGQDHVDKAEYTFGVRRSLEVRFSPWEFGVFFTLGYLSADPDNQKILYESVPRVVGNSAYNDSGLSLDLKTKPYKSTALGAGFNHVFDFGLSFGFGFLVGLRSEEAPDITVTSFGSDPASPADLELFRKKVEEEYLDGLPIGMFHLAIGYNF